MIVFWGKLIDKKLITTNCDIETIETIKIKSYYNSILKKFIVYINDILYETTKKVVSNIEVINSNLKGKNL